MHRLRNKKKEKVQQEDASPRPSQDSDSSGWFKKGKKPQEEPRVEIDLNSALPSTDDFRTSLLMTGLSARFSMLREQDDPNTKIGKALDDSVLQPKRRSQDINSALGALTGLSDIAEVESIRAPFLRGDYSDADAESTNGSVMTRSKPVDGNNLFGGRQKIYKIPAGKEGGIGGKALYDDDVAMSAFQRWRLEERRRRSFEAKAEDDNGADDASRDPSMEDQEARPESPFSTAYNRKRETTSTTSSFPSMARNSTAATSIISQQRTPSIIEGSSVSTAPTSANSTPALDRNFGRARRLYETGLSNEMHEQQSSALSRIDTLTRQRTMGSMGSLTPDMNQGSPSPTHSGFVDRIFGSERRVLAKGSAPNLRSVSPSTLRSESVTPDMGSRLPSAHDRRDFGGSPPLSPPISESEEISSLAIGPNDRGKATALGVFQKPSQGYDESRFAQRQLQLQQGRDTPTQRLRAESNTSFGSGGRSRSSSNQPQLHLKVEMPLGKTTEEAASPTFFDDSEASPIAPGEPTPVSLKSHDDHYGPESQDSAMPTPLSFANGEPSPTNNFMATLGPKTEATPADSPTLGPGAMSGLSGMVRQHLRADSGSSSIYGINSATSDLAPHGTDAAEESHDFSNTETPAVGVRTSFYNDDDDDDEVASEAGNPTGLAPASTKSLEQRKSRGAEEFANQLADGARRVRERLTFYVEADNAQSAPSLPLPSTPETASAQPSKLSGLGLLRPKSSLGSLMDRNRDSKAKKMIGFNASSAEENAALPPMKEEAPEETPANGNGDEGHAGIRAFRQARRELQRMKETEQQQRPEPPQGPPPEVPGPRGTPTKQRPSRQNSPSRERRPPPAGMYSRRPSLDSGPGSIRSASTASINAEHDRHGSHSSRERDASGPPPLRRLRNDSSPSGRLGQPDEGRRMVRSPGLPGTNVRGSPILPPQARMEGNKLQVQAASGMPSPGLPSSPRAFLNPQVNTNSDGSEVPGLNEAMKRSIKKKDISEPTFLMSTSRVPTVELPPEAASNRDRSTSRSRSNSRGDGYAPPLPPLNPRRRQDGSKTRTVFGSLSRSKTDVTDEASASAPVIVTPAAASDKAEGPVTRQLRRMASEAQGRNLNRPMGAPVNAPAVVSNIGRPAMVVANPNDRTSRTSAVLPGGMI